MKEVRIEYPFLFVFRKTTILHVPEEWIDLSGPQFAVCARVFTENISDEEFIAGFFGIKKSLAKRVDKFHQYKLIETVEFISNPKATINFFFLPEIPGTGLLAPEKKLKDITFEHFSIFDSLFFDYVNDKKEESLAKFIAALYLKKKEKITGIDFTARVRFIAEKVDKSTQYAIFLNYTFIRKWLSKIFPHLFGFVEDDPDEPKRKTIRPKKPNRPDWITVLDGLVGEDIINYERYKQLPCIVVFRTINKRIKNYNHGK
ncbi:MAG: hypothetical protein LBP72_02405 [Dysgonamonadaceae bacterium]|jgi:hypothetical protein|nr:hypothetical protein [Dysgonamonadaceae bacterium]